MLNNCDKSHQKCQISDNLDNLVYDYFNLIIQVFNILLIAIEKIISIAYINSRRVIAFK